MIVLACLELGVLLRLVHLSVHPRGARLSVSFVPVIQSVTAWLMTRNVPNADDRGRGRRRDSILCGRASAAAFPCSLRGIRGADSDIAAGSVALLPTAKLRAVIAWSGDNRVGLMDAGLALEAGRKPRRLR